MMAEVGYNPIEMARFFEKLQSESGNGIQFFSDHPNPGNRMRTIEAEIRTLPQRSYGFETGEFQQAKSQIASLPPPPARNTRTNLQPPAGAPSGGMRELSNRYFALQYPDAWQAYGDQNSGSVTIAPREGLVQTSRGGTSIGYGTVLSYFTPDSANAGLREATDDLIHHLRTENPGMRVTSRKPRSVRIAGSPGLVTMLESDSPYGGVETDAVLSIVRPEGLFYMVFIAPQQNFRNLESTFQRMIDSIRFTS
jgi:hypothetical protein